LFEIEIFKIIHVFTVPFNKLNVCPWWKQLLINKKKLYWAQTLEQCSVLLVSTPAVLIYLNVYLGYSAPGTPTANRFVGLSSRDPAFLHQQQVRYDPPFLPFSFFPLFSLKSPSSCSIFPTGVRQVAHQIIWSWIVGTVVEIGGCWDKMRRKLLTFVCQHLLIECTYWFDYIYCVVWFE